MPMPPPSLTRYAGCYSPRRWTGTVSGSLHGAGVGLLVCRLARDPVRCHGARERCQPHGMPGMQVQARGKAGMSFGWVLGMDHCMRIMFTVWNGADGIPS